MELDDPWFQHLTFPAYLAALAMEMSKHNASKRFGRIFS